MKKIGSIVLLLTMILCITSCRTGTNDEDYNGGYQNDYYNDSSFSYYEDDSNDYYTPSIEYISDRSVDYDETNKYHRVFFGLQDGNGNYISAESGTATIRIENDAGEVVYSKNIPFTSADFTTWTNALWGDSSRLLACIYIKDSALTKGSATKGTLSLSVVADTASFDAKNLSISDLPTKNISIKLPSTPQSFTDYDYDDDIEAIIRVDKITYDSRFYDYDDVTVTISFQTTTLFNSTPGTSKYIYIGYKLKNSSGIIVDSGTFSISPSDEGEVSLTEENIYDLSMKESYTLELTNSSN